LPKRVQTWIDPPSSLVDFIIYLVATPGLIVLVQLFPSQISIRGMKDFILCYCIVKGTHAITHFLNLLNASHAKARPPRCDAGHHGHAESFRREQADGTRLLGYSIPHLAENEPDTGSSEGAVRSPFRV
jgi:hypothetical protein